MGAALAIGIAVAAQAEVPDGARALSFRPARARAPLTAVTRPCGSSDAGDFFQLVVLDGAGRAVWTGPTRPDANDPLVFCACHHGVSLPECAGDIDGDGAIELLAPAPQSDVSPTYYRVLRWTGSAFVPVRTACLLEDPPRSGRYAWTTRTASSGRWVSRVRECRSGRLDVRITDYSGGEEVLQGTAWLETGPGGYRLVRWTRPMGPASDFPE